MPLLDFCNALAKGICDFLLTEPIYYFTGVLVLLAVGHIVRKIAQ